MGVYGSKDGLWNLPDGEFQKTVPMRCPEMLLKRGVHRLKAKGRAMDFLTQRKAIPTDTKWKQRPTCHYCSDCMHGCEIDSKYTSANRPIPLALRTGNLRRRAESDRWTGHGRLELSRFLTPPVVADHRKAPVNALGYLRVMFAVDDIDETLERLLKRGAQLVGEVVQYKDAYRLCYIRGPEGLLIGLAQELS